MTEALGSLLDASVFFRFIDPFVFSDAFENTWMHVYPRSALYQIKSGWYHDSAAVQVEMIHEVGIERGRAEEREQKEERNEEREIVRICYDEIKMHSKHRTTEILLQCTHRLLQ